MQHTTSLCLLLLLGLFSFLVTKGNPVPAGPVYCFQNHTPRGNYGPCDTEQTNPDDPDTNQFNSPQDCCEQPGAAGFTINRSGSRCSSCDSLSGEGENEGNEGSVVDGGWTDWLVWSDCSVTCGVGESTRTRTCTNPVPQNGGSECRGQADKSRVCDMGTCAVDGNWGDWSDYGACSETCGVDATQIRSRECDNPAPRDGGSTCEGTSEDIRFCQDIPRCPIDGSWSSWGQWTECSATCGDGQNLRQRFCNNPEAQYGGQECQGVRFETQPCQVTLCAIHGGWSEWSDWQDCSATECDGIGWQLRAHVCNNPIPQNGGRYCRGPSYNKATCRNTDACPVDGGISDWGAWGECSETCGEDSYRERRRLCDNPAARNNGQDCQERLVDAEDCVDLDPCPTEIPVIISGDGCDDEDEDCQNSGEGSATGPPPDPCAMFDSSYNYDLCKQGFGLPDVPGNEDNEDEMTVTTAIPAPVPTADNRNNFDYSY